MFGTRSLGFGNVRKFLKNKLIVLPESKYYLVPLLNHNLIINGPISHSACKVERRVEILWKKASFIHFQGGLICGQPRISGLSWASTQWHGGKEAICEQSQFFFAYCFPSASTHQVLPLFFLPPTPQIILFLWPNKHTQMWNCFSTNPNCFKRSWK